jgi:hypothetical protein
VRIERAERLCSAAKPIRKTDMPKTKPVVRFESFNEIATIRIELEDTVEQMK